MGILLFCILLPTVISQPSKTRQEPTELDYIRMPFGINSQSNIGFGMFLSEKTTLYQKPSVNFSDNENYSETNARKSEERGSLLNNFLFHRVDLESSLDPFTKRPYHRTILAMRALPDSGKPIQNDSIRSLQKSSGDFFLPHYYFIFNNKSVRSWQKGREEAVQNDVDKVQQRKKDASNETEHSRNSKHQSKNSKNDMHLFHHQFNPLLGNLRYRRKQQRQIRGNNEIGRNADKIEDKRDNPMKQRNNSDSDAAWISSYLGEKGKINTFQKQLRFLHRWLSRLDRRELKKIRHKQRKKQILFLTAESNKS